VFRFIYMNFTEASAKTFRVRNVSDSKLNWRTLIYWNFIHQYYCDTLQSRSFQTYLNSYSVGYTLHYSPGSLFYKHLWKDFIKFSIENDHSTPVAFLNAPPPYPAKPLECTLKWPYCLTVTYVYGRSVSLAPTYIMQGKFYSLIRVKPSKEGKRHLISSQSCIFCGLSLSNSKC
jgi:hypothetical protein